MTKRILGLAMFVLLAFSGPALAGLAEGQGEIGFDYGTTDYDSDIAADSANSLSLRGGYLINRMFEIEGQFATSSEEVDIVGIGVDTTMRLYMVNGVLNFHPRDEIVPYVMVGVGMANLEVESSGVSVDDQGVAYQVGAGTRFFFGKNKRTAFRIDVSRVSEDTFNDNSSHTTFAGGFTWRLGR